MRRIYFYHWLPSSDPLPTWDSALVDPRGKPRPAYDVLKRFIVSSRARRRGGRERGGLGPSSPSGAEGMSRRQAPP